MKLYKYRSLHNLEFILDVLLNERLHCAPYTKLNGPFEGVFYTAYPPPARLRGILTRKTKK